MKNFLIIMISLLMLTSAKGQILDMNNCDLIKKTQFKKQKIKICNKVIEVEIAETPIQREVGLMCRTELSQNAGMLFVFDEEKPLSFWMKNTQIPLSLGYINKEKKLIETYDMAPMNETNIYVSSQKSLYALETNQGWFKKNKVKPGCQLQFLKK